MYANEIEDGTTENHMKINAGDDQDHVGRALAFLIGIVCSESYPDSERSQSRKKQLLEEIELFTRCLMEEDET